MSRRICNYKRSGDLQIELKLKTSCIFGTSRNTHTFVIIKTSLFFSLPDNICF